ncbi:MULTISPECIES: S-formylglutathione hydrolase [unclassified Moraxella]|uniref:S-formylglutathione hydrolase n=1 Tax=unclassified Moraxella TaxID=2685852 RepID=UPI003AF600E9
MQQLENYKIFGGQQQVWQHHSDTLNCEMNFAIYLPESAEKQALPVLYWLSGLTCTEQNFITKSGFQRYANEHHVIVVAPDTSPRGDDVADDEAYDLGKGAGFYVNATQEPWSKHYKMYDYIVHELPKLIAEHFNVTDKKSIFGHSMGGHGALIIALRETGSYQSVSAFAPIVAPTQVPWGQKAFTAYLGNDEKAWQNYDATWLIRNTASSSLNLPILIDQGDVDKFLVEQLRPELFTGACTDKGVACEYHSRAGYDHSYYFIASFIGEHIAFHARALNG